MCNYSKENILQSHNPLTWANRQTLGISTFNRKDHSIIKFVPSSFDLINRQLLIITLPRGNCWLGFRDSSSQTWLTDPKMYLMGDHDGVLNLPLMWPTSLSMASFSSWYSFTSVLSPVHDYLVSKFMLVHDYLLSKVRYMTCK